MLTASVTAALIYLLITGLRVRELRINQAFNRPLLGTLALLAIVLHGYAAWAALQSPEGINLGFFKVSSLIFWVVNVAFLLSLLRRPLENLLLELFPLSAIAVIISALAPGNISPFGDISGGMILHISSSVMAYAVLTLATGQAALVAAQDYQLHNHHASGFVRALPPLQLMETMLFELLWIGLVLLSLSIASGMVFLDDMFAQHLVHKTVLTLLAWVLFATLLWGHHSLGWRAQTAVKFTLTGFAVLMLGYFGSKLVLEVILQKA